MVLNRCMLQMSDTVEFNSSPDSASQVTRRDWWWKVTQVRQGPNFALGRVAFTGCHLFIDMTDLEPWFHGCQPWNHRNLAPGSNAFSTGFLLVQCASGAASFTLTVTLGDRKWKLSQ